MTLASESNKLQFAGNGSTTAFAITFNFWADSNIVATLRSATGVETVWALGTNYTLTGGSATGATGTLTATGGNIPASGETLTIASNVPTTQPTDLPVGGPFPSTSVETQLDQLSRQVAQVERITDRCLKFPETDALALTAAFLSSVDRASRIAGFDSAGNVTLYSATTPAYALLSAAAAPVDPQYDVVKARNNLNFGILY